MRAGPKDVPKYIALAIAVWVGVASVIIVLGGILSYLVLKYLIQPDVGPEMLILFSGAGGFIMYSLLMAIGESSGFGWAKKLMPKKKESQ